MEHSLGEQEKKVEEGVALTQREKCYLVIVSVFFAILPTRVFSAISSDVIQIAAIIVPLVIAFMALMLSIDITYGLPIPSDASEKISKRRQTFSDGLVSLLRYGLALVLAALVAKSIVIWFADSNYVLAIATNHFAAWTVGGLVATLLIKVRDISNIYGYLSVGADIAQRVRMYNRDVAPKTRIEPNG